MSMHLVDRISKIRSYQILLSVLNIVNYFSPWDVCISHVHVVIDLLLNHFLRGCVQVKEDVLVSIHDLFHAIDHNNTCGSEPHCIVALDVWIALNDCFFVQGWNGVKSVWNSPSDNCTVASNADRYEFFTPMIVFVIHVKIDKTRLWDILTLVQFKFLSHIYEIRCIDQSVI